MISSSLADRAPEALRWLPELGIGYLPVVAQPYDSAYFLKYQAMAGTPMGREITRRRVELVRRVHAGPVLDVGIGCGSFIEAHGHAVGADVNPAGLAWLRERGLEWDGGPVEAATFWDSLEHIHEPGDLLGKVARWVFVSVPLVPDVARITTWKHFRRDEHCWYFTAEGLLCFMRWHGFELRHRDDFETRLGREDIGTFIFERI